MKMMVNFYLKFEILFFVSSTCPYYDYSGMNQRGEETHVSFEIQVLHPHTD